MKSAIPILIALLSMLASCYEVYKPNIDTGNKVLVVNGLITNKTDVYHILLSNAEPFNSIAAAEPVREANVYITDDLGNSYLFNEKKNGNYSSDSLQFTGKPGRIYRLHIGTPDGEKYESDPQRLFSEEQPDTVYAEFDTKETLDRNSGLKVYTHGANILANIQNKADTFPRYRFTSNLVIQYYYYKLVPADMDHWFHFDFYCWNTVNANPNINMTGGEYSLSSASERKHPVCFLDDNFSVWALIYGLRINEQDWSGSVVQSTSYQFYDVHHRILYLNQYTLNNETYLYYKSLDEQMQSEGKLFDPIAAQINGNIRCVSNPKKKAIGFFEASSVSRSAFIVDFRNLKGSQPVLIRTSYILPPELNGCRIDKVGDEYNDIPLFWILI